MSLETDKGRRYCICDSCGEELKDTKGHAFTFARDEFDVFLERMNEEGWLSEKNKHGEWVHTCSDCQE
jgi:hypothetical protein